MARSHNLPKVHADTLGTKIGLLAASIFVVNACSGNQGSTISSGLGGGGTFGGNGSLGQGGSPSIGGEGHAGGASGMVGIGMNGTGGSTSTTGESNTRGGAAATGGSSTSVGGAGGSATGGRASAGGASTGGSSSTAGASSSHWVGTWSASPYVDANSNNTPPISISNSVIRQVTHVSLGGSQLRVQFSNLFGNGALTINSAHIALCKATPAVDSTIDTATDKALAFSGTASVTIAQGKEVWSDPIDFAVANQGNISITTAFGSVPSTLTQHSGSRTTSYFQSGSTDVSAASMASAQKKDLWFFISGIDVMADASAKAAVAIGDSITDGRGTDTNKNNRWTDILAARLQGNAATAKVAMLNQGIGGTNLIGTSGTAAQARFDRDVLGQSGVRYAIVYDGVNDIGNGASFASLKAAYDDLISRAHGKGLLIYGATITPFGGYSSYYSVDHESVRQQVNTYIKSGVFDGYIDFDAALSDGGSPPKLQTAYATWAQTDGLHPGPAGYQKMGDTPDFTLFTK
jgi:lysophospholipase L1-like esterase